MLFSAIAPHRPAISSPAVRSRTFERWSGQLVLSASNSAATRSISCATSSDCDGRVVLNAGQRAILVRMPAQPIVRKSSIVVILNGAAGLARDAVSDTELRELFRVAEAMRRSSGCRADRIRPTSFAQRASARVSS
jgi:hypothetical protein